MLSIGNRSSLNGEEVSNIPSLVCALLASATSGGTVYAFGIYSDELKKNLQLSQSQLDAISTSLFVAGIIGWIPGLIVDRFGPRIALICGGINGSLSTILFWIIARNIQLIQPLLRYFVPTTMDSKVYHDMKTPSTHIIPILCMLSAFIFLSCALIVASCFKIIMISCYHSKGQAVGVCKAYVGLGAGIYVAIFSLFAPYCHTLDFLILTSILFVVCVIVPALLLLPQPKQQQVVNNIISPTGLSSLCAKREPIRYRDDITLRHYQLLYRSLLVLVVLILLHSTSQLFSNDIDDSKSSSFKFVGILIAIIWIAPIQYLLRLPVPSPNITGPEAYVDVEMLQKETTRLIASETTPTTSSSNGIFEDDVSPRIINAVPSTTNTAYYCHEASVISSSISVDTKPSQLDDDENLARYDSCDCVEEDSNDTFCNDCHEDDEPNFTIFEMLQSPAAHLLLFTCVILIGNGVLETNNMGQMVESLSFPNPQKITQASLALFSIAQATSRVFAGSCSEWVLQLQAQKQSKLDPTTKMVVGRPIFLLLASLITFVAHMVLAAAEDPVTFVIGVVLAGIGFGITWPMMVLIVGEIFGKTHFGGNYMVFDGCTISLGAIIFSDFLAGGLYERNVQDDVSDEKGWSNTTCFGPSCFRTTHLVVSSLALVSAFTSCLLLYSTRDTYVSIVHRLGRRPLATSNY